MERGPRFGAIRTARMEAEIIDGWREPPQCQVAFGECAGDRNHLLPETRGIARCERGQVRVGKELSAWQERHIARDLFRSPDGDTNARNAAHPLVPTKTSR